MLAILRKIRKTMIESGSIRKYLFYAIGGILLVMIGILLALQVNNWNEWRKDRIKEKVILTDLVKNLEINIQTFKEDIEWLQQNNRSSQVIISALERKQDYADSLRQHFHNARITKQELFVSEVGYQAMKNQGTDIITEKKLVNEVLNLYEVFIPSTLATNVLVNEEDRLFVNHLVQNFNLIKGVGLTPNNYESLFSDNFYISWIKAYAEGRKYLIDTDRKFFNECERVLKLVKDELDKK